MSEPDAIDRVALDDLLATTGGDPGFLAELIDAYVEDAPGLLAALRQALATGDAEAFRRAAHTLKSNSANFGAHTLAAQCKELEDRGRAGELDGVEEQLARLDAEYAKVRRALLALRPAG